MTEPCPRCGSPARTPAGETRQTFPAFPDRPPLVRAYAKCQCGKIFGRTVPCSTGSVGTTPADTSAGESS